MPGGNLPGYEALGGDSLETAAAVSAIVTVEARDLLFIYVGVVGFSTADIPALRFGTTGGAVDSGANYYDRHFYSAAGAAAPNTNVQNPSTTMLRVAHVTGTRNVCADLGVLNIAGASHPAFVAQSTATGAAATVQNADIALGEWFNTGQILSVQLISVAGQNMLAGSGFTVQGRNFG